MRQERPLQSQSKDPDPAHNTLLHLDPIARDADPVDSVLIPVIPAGSRSQTDGVGEANVGAKGGRYEDGSSLTARCRTKEEPRGRMAPGSPSRNQPVKAIPQERSALAPAHAALVELIRRVRSRREVSE